MINTITKKYNNRDWLYNEYVIKKRTSGDISRECGVSGTWILNRLHYLNIPVRSMRWDNDDIKKVIALHDSGKTVKEISSIIDKDYSSVRNLFYTRLKLHSNYSPAMETRKPEVRRKISATLQKINISDWSGFKQSDNVLIRKSCEYDKWRQNVFIRDKYTCQVCGAHNAHLVAHHIKSFANNRELRLNVDNGITLCQRCHKSTHEKEGYSSWARGEDIRSSKLSSGDIISIRNDIASRKLTNAQIAEQYNVSAALISCIKVGKIWNHVSGGEKLNMICDMRSILCENDIRKIKMLLADGELSQKEIANMYGVCGNTISRIKTGKRWRRVQ